MTLKSVTINGRQIGPDFPPYIIAEMSGNHNGDINRALALMEEAKTAGADAVKLQTYTADTMTIDHDGEDFMVRGGLWDGYKLFELYEEAHTPWEWHERLFKKGRELGLTVFSTPFDPTAVDFLEGFDPPAYKIASFEVVDLDLIAKVAQTGKPMIISTGMAAISEISDAVTTARENGGNELILLHCVSAYPAPADDANLRTISNLSETFSTIGGLSDHTHGIAVSVAAIAQGASVIEKHFTLRRADGGPDATFSLEPEELADLVQSTRMAWLALGDVNYEREKSETQSMIFRRSLYITEDIAAGEELTKDNVRVIRPGYGLAPKYLGQVLGRQTKDDVKRGTALAWNLLR